MRAPARAQEHPHRDQAGQAPVLGHVDFRNAGNAAAQAPLQRGVALLHSFMYGDAARAFQQAQRADPTLALARWLEALTYSHVLWGEEDLLRARSTLTAFASTRDARLTRARSPRERSFGAAVEAFFAEAPLAVRARAYADSLRRLANSDTTDIEAAAFAAHAAMIAWFTSSPAERGNLIDVTRSLALRAFAANPQHPGAAHYLTHLADMDPRSAADELTAARAYDKIAPDADHALHMPSHVYLPLGMWKEVSAANERAWPASRRAVARNNGTPSDLSWHSLKWLQYSYLQEGRWREARALVDTAHALLRNFSPPDAEPDSRFAVNAMAFAYGAETNDWNAWPSGPPDVARILAFPTPTPRAWGMTMTAAYQSAVGALLGSGDTSRASLVSHRFRQIADTLRNEQPKADLIRAATQLDALLARTHGDTIRAIRLLRRITSEPQSASTPPTHLSTSELLGEMLMQHGQPAEAAAAYQAALAARPNRSRALLGLVRALAAAGDGPGAARAKQALRVNWQRADDRVKNLLQ